MLKIRTFKLADYEEINKFLDLYPRANGGTVFMSNGEIAIPYEDGKPETKEVKKIRLQDQTNGLSVNLEQIELSIQVDEQQIIDANKRIADIDSKITVLGGSKESYDNNKALEKEKEAILNFINQAEQGIRQNKAEATRLRANIAIHEKNLESLN